MKKSTKTNSTKELNTIKGTVSNVIESNMEYINSICTSSKSLEEIKSEIVALLEKESKKCKSRDAIINNIKSQTSKEKLTYYVYDLWLAGAGLAVVKVG